MAGKSKLRTQDMLRLAEAAALNKSMTAVAKELGISKATACRAVKRPEVQALFEKRREALIEKCESVAERALDKITDKKLEASSASQLSVIAGINIEKAALLRNGPNAAGIHVTINIGDPTTRQVTLQGNNDTIDVTPE